MIPPEETAQQYVERVKKRDNLSVDVMLFTFFLIAAIVGLAVYLRGEPLR